MPHTRYTNDEIVRRGREMYDRDVRIHVEPQHKGEFLALDIETGEYEIAPEAVAAVRRAKARHSDAAVFILRIGYPTAYRLGGRFRTRNT